MLRCSLQNYLGLPNNGDVTCQGAVWVNSSAKFKRPRGRMNAGTVAMLTRKVVLACIEVLDDEGGGLISFFCLSHGLATMRPYLGDISALCQSKIVLSLPSVCPVEVGTFAVCMQRNVASVSTEYSCSMANRPFPFLLSGLMLLTCYQNTKVQAILKIQVLMQ